MIIIGIGGASGSGKTEVALHIQAQLGDRCAILKGDDFYRHCPEKTAEERKLTNYDVISSKDFDLLVDLINQFVAGEKITYQQYDFVSHLRGTNTLAIDPANVDYLLIDDILALAYEPLRNIFDVSVYVHADMDLAFIRRLTRDTAPLDQGGRGRMQEDVVAQYLTTVRPAFIEGIEPTKDKAQHVVENNTTTKDAINIKPVMDAIKLLVPVKAPKIPARPNHTLLTTVGHFATPESAGRILPVNDASAVTRSADFSSASQLRKKSC